ncbi:MAG: hypothetical protein RIF32_06065 [Leptospirales bacterium]|jgi:hypothetical protein
MWPIRHKRPRTTGPSSAGSGKRGPERPGVWAAFATFGLCALLGPGRLSFDCSPVDVVCNPEALLLYFEPDCNFMQTLNLGAPSGADGASGVAQQAYVKASNADDCDEFGTGIAFDFATQTLVVGSVEEASNATGVNGDQLDNSLRVSYPYLKIPPRLQKARCTAGNSSRGVCRR